MYKYINTNEEARNADSKAINSYNIPSLVLMERAALSSVNVIIDYIKEDDKILILCGPGNNGGDGFAIGRLLHQKGYNVNFYDGSSGKMSADEKTQYSIIEKLKINCTSKFEKLENLINSSDVIIDCIFGSGLSRNIEGTLKKVIELCNLSSKFIISIDIPSGINGNNGKVMGITIKPDLTIALDCYKYGHFIDPGKSICKKITCVDIGIPNEIHKNLPYPIYFTDRDCVRAFLPERYDNSHKGMFKKALIIGGSIEMQGAVTMCAKACYRSGIGTLTMYVPKSIQPIIASKLDFAMSIGGDDKNGYFSDNAINKLQEVIYPYHIVAIGNGMGKNRITEKMVETVLKTEKTVIIDADGLCGLKNNLDLLDRDADTILTPHIKEMSYLTGKTIPEILEDPFNIVKEFCQKYKNCTLVLKSDYTLIANCRKIFLHQNPTSALSKGGSGDILAGIITGLMGHNIRPTKASVCACEILTSSAKKCLDPASAVPQDIIDNMPSVFSELRR